MKHRLNIAFLILAYAAIITASFYYDVSRWWLLLPTALFLIIAGLGSAFIKSQYHVKALCGIKTTRRQVSITFDDGPTPATEQVLDLLHKYNMKGTFFCIGKQIEKYPQILARTVSEGHTIGNHTYSHSSKLSLFSNKQVVQEIMRTNELIANATGLEAKLFRPPFGVTAPNIAKALRATAHTVIGWNIRSLDAVTEDEQKIFKRIKSRVRPGSIILLHDTSLKSVNVLEQLLVLLQENNYEAITVDRLLNITAYEE